MSKKESANTLGITDADVATPLRALVRPSRRRVIISDMADYYEVFFGAEGTTVYYFENHPDLEDSDVILAYESLLGDFDGSEEGSLADNIAKGIKAILIWRRKKGMKDFTMGEILSCLRYLLEIAVNHHDPGGRGYLMWIKAFIERKKPTGAAEMPYIH